MKSALKVLAIITKIVTVIMAIVGVIMAITVRTVSKVYNDHIYDVLGEADINPDIDEDRAALMNEAFVRTMDDPRIRQNRIINAVCYGVGWFTSIVAHL